MHTTTKETSVTSKVSGQTVKYTVTLPQYDSLAEATEAVGESVILAEYNKRYADKGTTNPHGDVRATLDENDADSDEVREAVEAAQDKSAAYVLGTGSRRGDGITQPKSQKAMRELAPTVATMDDDDAISGADLKALFAAAGIPLA